MKLNKVLFLTAIVSSVCASSAFADDSVSTGTAHWYGSAQIIPGTTHTITGENGVLKLEDGELNIQADGTFTSTAVVMESHELTGDDTMAIQDRIGAKVDTVWKLDLAKFDWGSENGAAASEISKNITFTDQISGTSFAVGGSEEVTASQVNMVVENATPTTVTNAAAEAHVQATFVSTLVGPVAP
ncbi:hypothetical protein I3256_08475 [Photobacterium damselae]|uniref:hypothetical protein n=1 Tax=Photobacterium damselae TaxID=38293 RepID=UPI001EE0AB34|nr:hypothetical protein [Photobacterium damselae]MCG3815973.1 hypothetical protein [Photobacterium damselae]